jgi:AcrR family transcriptional regulator
MTEQKMTYHHGDLPDALTNAAIKRIAAQGVEKLSLRAVARDIGVSQTAPYRHFKDKNHLLAAIAKQGFEMLTALKASSCSEMGTLQEIINGGIQYVKFAIANPERYQLMFGSKLDNSCDYEGLKEARAASFNVVIEQIERGKASGVLINEDSDILAKSCWTTAHGISSLIINGFFQNIDYEFEDFLTREITLCVRGIAKDPSSLS